MDQYPYGTSPANTQVNPFAPTPPVRHSNVIIIDQEQDPTSSSTYSTPSIRQMSSRQHGDSIYQFGTMTQGQNQHSLTQQSHNPSADPTAFRGESPYDPVQQWHQEYQHQYYTQIQHEPLNNLAYQYHTSQQRRHYYREPTTSADHSFTQSAHEQFQWRPRFSQHNPPQFTQPTISSVSRTVPSPRLLISRKGRSISAYSKVSKNPNLASYRYSERSASAETFSASTINPSSVVYSEIESHPGENEMQIQRVEEIEGKPQLQIIDAIEFMLKYDSNDLSKVFCKELPSETEHETSVELLEDPRVVAYQVLIFEGLYYVAVELVERDFDFARKSHLKPVALMPFKFETNLLFVENDTSDPTFMRKLTRNKSKYLDPIFGIFGDFETRLEGSDLVLKVGKIFRQGLYKSLPTSHNFGKLYIKIDLFSQISASVRLRDEEDYEQLAPSSEEFEEITPKVQVIDFHLADVIDSDDEKKANTSAPSQKRRGIRRFSVARGLLFNDFDNKKKQRKASPTQPVNEPDVDNKEPQKPNYFASVTSSFSTPRLSTSVSDSALSSTSSSISTSRPTSSHRKNKVQELEATQNEIKRLITLDNSLRANRVLRSSLSKSPPIQVDITQDSDDEVEEDLEPIESSFSSSLSDPEQSAKKSRSTSPIQRNKASEESKAYTYFEGDHDFVFKDIASNYLIIRHVEKNDYDLKEFISEIQERVGEDGANLLQASYCSRYKYIALKLQNKTSVITTLQRVHGFQFNNGKVIKIAMCDANIGKKIFSECDEDIYVYDTNKV